MVRPHVDAAIDDEEEEDLVEEVVMMVMAVAMLAMTMFAWIIIIVCQ